MGTDNTDDEIIDVDKVISSRPRPGVARARLWFTRLWPQIATHSFGISEKNKQ